MDRSKTERVDDEHLSLDIGNEVAPLIVAESRVGFARLSASFAEGLGDRRRNKTTLGANSPE